MNLQEPETHLIRDSTMMRELEPERETIHLVSVAWWMEEIFLEIEVNSWNMEGKEIHWLVMKPKRSREQNIRRINKILDRPPLFPINMDCTTNCFKVMVWNCRGAGNANFRRNFVDLNNMHKPQIVALLEN